MSLLASLPTMGFDDVVAMGAGAAAPFVLIMMPDLPLIGPILGTTGPFLAGSMARQYMHNKPITCLDVRGAAAGAVGASTAGMMGVYN